MAKTRLHLLFNAAQQLRELPGTVVGAVLAGSWAYGLATEQSDVDVRAIFCADPRLLLGLEPPPETLEVSRDGVDVAAHEIGKFCRLALKGNPSALEVLWAQDCIWSGPGIELRALRGCFLHRGVLRAYAGYAADQLRRLRSAGPQRQGKAAMHLLRLLISAHHLAEHGDLLVDVSGRRDHLLAVRRGEVPIDQVEEEARQMLSALERRASGELPCMLPERPREDAIRAFVVDCRLDMLDAIRHIGGTS